MNTFRGPIGILPPSIVKRINPKEMNESITFVKDDPKGRYAEEDTGVMVAVIYTAFYGDTAVVRTTDNTYITAPLADVEYAAGED